MAEFNVNTGQMDVPVPMGTTPLQAPVPLAPTPTMAPITQVPQAATPAATPSTFPELDAAQLERLQAQAKPPPEALVQEILTARSTAAKADEADAVFNNRVKTMNEQANGFWPTAIAVAAMASGQFGPMWQLQEHKRQTRIASLMAPTVTEAIRMSMTGDIEGAEKLMGKVIANVGDNAPEFTKAILPLQKQINTDRLSLRDMKADLERLDREDLKEGTAMWNFRESIRHNYKFGIPISREQYAAMEQMSRPHLQIINDAARAINPITGRIEQETPLQAVIPPTKFNTVAGHQIAYKAGLESPEELVNVVNMKPGDRLKVSGIDVAYGDAVYNRVMGVYHQNKLSILGELAGKEAPLEPGLHAALLEELTPEQIATRSFPPGSVQRAIARDQLRKIGVALAPIQWSALKDPLRMEGMGLELFDATDVGFGKPLDPRSYEAFVAAGGRVGVIKTALKPEFTAAVNAYNNLQWGEDFWNALDNPTKFEEVLTSGTLRLIQDRLRIKLDPKKGIQDAAEAIVDKAIEQVFSSLKLGTPTQDSAEIQRLKDSVKGKFTDAATGRQALAQLQIALRDRITGISGKTPAIPTPGTTRGTEGRQQQQTTGTQPAASMREGGQYQPAGESTLAPKGAAPIPKGTAAARARANQVLNAPSMEDIQQAAETAQQQGATVPTAPTAPLQNIAPPGQRRRLQLTR